MTAGRADKDPYRSSALVLMTVSFSLFANRHNWQGLHEICPSRQRAARGIGLSQMAKQRCLS